MSLIRVQMMQSKESDVKMCFETQSRFYKFRKHLYLFQMTSGDIFKKFEKIIKNHHFHWFLHHDCIGAKVSDLGLHVTSKCDFGMKK